MTACMAVIPPDINLGREVQIYEFVRPVRVRDWRRDVVAKDVPAGTVLMK
jgi:hypothetical protein